MIFIKSRTLGPTPYLLGFGGLSFATFVLLMQIANVRATMPIVQVPDADGIGFLDPMEYTEAYGIGVAQAFLEKYLNWSPETYGTHMTESAAFLHPNIRHQFYHTWMSHHAGIVSTNESQIATIEKHEVFDFDENIGLSIVLDIVVEKYYTGLPYKPIRNRVILALENTEPRDDYPFCLSVTYVKIQQLTMEG